MIQWTDILTAMSREKCSIFQNLNQNFKRIQIFLVCTGNSLTDILNKSFYTLYLRQLRPNSRAKWEIRYRWSKEFSERPFDVINSWLHNCRRVVISNKNGYIDVGDKCWRRYINDRFEMWMTVFFTTRVINMRNSTIMMIMPSTMLTQYLVTLVNNIHLSLKLDELYSHEMSKLLYPPKFR